MKPTKLKEYKYKIARCIQDLKDEELRQGNLRNRCCQLCSGVYLESGISQSKIAKSMEVSLSYFHKMLHGERAWTAEMLSRFSGTVESLLNNQQSQAE